MIYGLTILFHYYFGVGYNIPTIAEKQIDCMTFACKS